MTSTNDAWNVERDGEGHVVYPDLYNALARRLGVARPEAKLVAHLTMYDAEAAIRLHPHALQELVLAYAEVTDASQGFHDLRRELNEGGWDGVRQFPGYEQTMTKLSAELRATAARRLGVDPRPGVRGSGRTGAALLALAPGGLYVWHSDHGSSYAVELARRLGRDDVEITVPSNLRSKRGLSYPEVAIDHAAEMTDALRHDLASIHAVKTYHTEK